jgi:DNA-binding beta-propeller fold protein YncE
MNLYRDPDDGFSTVISATLVDSSTSGATTASIIGDGEYYVWSYTACPWQVTISNGGHTVYVSNDDLRARWLAWDSAVADALTSLLDANDPVTVANAATAIGYASKDAASWIDATSGRVRQKQVKAVQSWRNGVAAADALGEAIYVANATGSGNQLRDAEAGVPALTTLRRKIADLFAVIQ